MSIALTLLMLFTLPSESLHGVSGSVVGKTGQVQHLPAAVALSLSQRLLPYLNSCWLNSDTASLYLPPPLGPEEDLALAWEKVLESPHFRLLLSEPLRLSDAVGGQEISEIIFALDELLVLSRHHAQVTKYRVCELPWTDVTCPTDLVSYLPAKQRSDCDFIRRMQPPEEPIPRQNLTLVFIRQTDIDSPLTIDDERQFLRPSDIDMLQGSGLTGRLTPELYSSDLAGRLQARALVVLCGPLDRLHRLPVPSATTVVYIQRASGFATFPPMAVVGAESIELYPDEDDPAAVSYWKKLATGRSGGDVLTWGARSKPGSTCGDL